MFDCDGLLVDSTAAWHGAYAAVASAHGQTLDAVSLDAFAGASVGAAAARLGEELGVDVGEHELERALLARFASAPPRLLPGARALTAALRTRMPLAVASNAPRALVEAVVDDIGAFDAVVTVEDVAAHKPAPDVYVEACRRLGVAPSDAIAFEDSAVGARAARAAGLMVIAVPSSSVNGIDADLTVSRLDDPLLFRYLRLA